MKYILLLVPFLLVTINGGKIKVIDGPFAFNNPAAGISASRGEVTHLPLIARALPAKPSGPKYLIDNLYGHCFESIFNTYKYAFCPFQNVTQREQSYKWNAFHGVLGVWKEWVIINNTFEAMLMVHGDTCSPSLDRQVKIFMQCGSRNEILSVKEPSMCRYEMEFKSPFACPKDVFHVYPILSAVGRIQFREIEESFMLGDITQKGYDKRRKQLFTREGLMVEEIRETLLQISDRREVPLTTVKTYKANLRTANNTDLFENKELCFNEYQKLLQEKNDLSKELEKLVQALELRNLTAGDFIRLSTKGDHVIKRNSKDDTKIETGIVPQ